MPNTLVFSIRYLQPRSHGRGDSGEPEWPPSPLRLFQSLVAASAARWNERQQLTYAAPALRWLELLTPPEIVSPIGIASAIRTQFYVPDNTADLLVSAWKKGEADATPKRTEKVVRSVHLLGDAVVHYLFTLPDGQCEHFEVLKAAARSVTHLGWGIDMVVGDADILDADQAGRLDGVRWHPSSASGTSLRVHKTGTLDDLIRKHADFLNRITDGGFRPVPPLGMFDVVRYRRDSDPLSRPHAVFKLVDEYDDMVAHPPAKLIHIAGMVRHLAIELMKTSSPRDLRGIDSAAWVRAYVAGHQSKEDKEAGVLHSQFSYIPLQSIGHEHANPSVRRVMIAAPLGDDAWLDHLAQRLDGQLLQPLSNTKLPDGTRLERIEDRRQDGVRDKYVRPSAAWASVTPVILPGHDDHKPEKTRKLIEKALAQSGIEQPCEFEWSAFSRFPKSLSAHKYDRQKRPTGYIRPGHLLNQTAIHLQLRFEHDVPGPIAIGAGRHCGFGLMAAAVN